MTADGFQTDQDRAAVCEPSDAVRAAVQAERERCADICRRLGETYMAESDLYQRLAPGTRAGEIPAWKAGTAWKCEAAVRGEPFDGDAEEGE